MSVLEKCERIGAELRKTKEGHVAIENFAKITKNPQDLPTDFFSVVNRHYTLHFYSIQNAILLFEANRDNEMVGFLAQNILSVKGIRELGESNIPIGKFVEELGLLAFSNSVKYQLPADITATPELIRLSNALTVECQRINLVQQFGKEFYTDTKFQEAVNRFDVLKSSEPVIPLSKEDRNILKALKKEFPNTKVEMIYSLFSTITYIKCMIFDSFYENIYEVYEADNVIAFKEKTLNNRKFMKLVMHPTIKTMNPNTGWILKLHCNDNSVRYAQIFYKSMNFSQNECKITVHAIAHDYLL